MTDTNVCPHAGVPYEGLCPIKRCPANGSKGCAYALCGRSPTVETLSTLYNEPVEVTKNKYNKGIVALEKGALLLNLQSRLLRITKYKCAVCGMYRETEGSCNDSKECLFRKELRETFSDHIMVKSGFILSQFIFALIYQQEEAEKISGKSFKSILRSLNSRKIRKRIEKHLSLWSTIK